MSISSQLKSSRKKIKCSSSFTSPLEVLAAGENASSLIKGHMGLAGFREKGIINGEPVPGEGVATYRLWVNGKMLSHFGPIILF